MKSRALSVVVALWGLCVLQACASAPKGPEASAVAGAQPTPVVEVEEKEPPQGEAAWRVRVSADGRHLEGELVAHRAAGQDWRYDAAQVQVQTGVPSEEGERITWRFPLERLAPQGLKAFDTPYYTLDSRQLGALLPSLSPAPQELRFGFELPADWEVLFAGSAGVAEVVTGGMRSAGIPDGRWVFGAVELVDGVALAGGDISTQWIVPRGSRQMLRRGWALLGSLVDISARRLGRPFPAEDLVFVVDPRLHVRGRLEGGIWQLGASEIFSAQRPHVDADWALHFALAEQVSRAWLRQSGVEAPLHEALSTWLSLAWLEELAPHFETASWLQRVRDLILQEARFALPGPIQPAPHEAHLAPWVSFLNPDVLGATALRHGFRARQPSEIWSQIQRVLSPDNQAEQRALAAMLPAQPGVGRPLMAYDLRWQCHPGSVGIQVKREPAGGGRAASPGDQAFCFYLSDGRQKHPHCETFSGGAHTFTLPLDFCPTFAHPNLGEAGSYRWTTSRGPLADARYDRHVFAGVVENTQHGFVTGALDFTGLLTALGPLFTDGISAPELSALLATLAPAASLGKKGRAAQRQWAQILKDTQIPRGSHAFATYRAGVSQAWLSGQPLLPSARVTAILRGWLSAQADQLSWGPQELLMAEALPQYAAGLSGAQAQSLRGSLDVLAAKYRDPWAQRLFWRTRLVLDPGAALAQWQAQVGGEGLSLVDLENLWALTAGYPEAQAVFRGWLGAQAPAWAALWGQEAVSARLLPLWREGAWPNGIVMRPDQRAALEADRAAHAAAMEQMMAAIAQWGRR